MNTFLSTVARDLIGRFGSNLQDVTIVFPGKRAGLFLTQELAQLVNGPLWAPEYTSMDSLFQSFTPLTPTDSIEAICTLLRLMQRIIPEEQMHTLDQLWGWGEVILSDFDDIDKHMANARLVLANVYDQHSLEGVDFLTEEQEQALQHFFSNFSIEGNTAIKERFLHIWSHMYELYEALQDTLEARGTLYPGALYRRVIANLKAQPALTDEYLRERKAVVFVGFNVLNDVEHALMQEIERSGKGLFYWDYDSYYVNDETNEAGTFMRQNLLDFPCALGREEYDNMKHLQDVTFISCTTDNAAARYTQEWLEGSHDSQANRNAVVLCNESLLHPVLHALPEGVKEVNVTMGFPLADTPIYSLLMALVSLHTEGYDAARHCFRYPFLQAVRRHAYACMLGDEADWGGTWQGEQSTTLLEWMDRMLQRVGTHFAEHPQPLPYDILYMEAIFHTHRILQQFIRMTQASEDALDVLPGTMRRLLRSVLVRTSIPFHGEPAQGLQVMGVLETRCLDFSHLLMLSVEEGMLPRTTQSDTMIPADIREAFGLTTPRHRNAVYAYYFYRLIQRTRHLTCVYNENSSGNTHHEMSRFLRQLLAETHIPIHTIWLRSNPQVSGVEPMSVCKDQKIMERMRNKYDQSLPEGKHVTLSPSAINTYMACPMKFYFQYVAGLQPEQEQDEGLQPSDIGNIFHDTAQVLYERTMRRAGSRTLPAHVLYELLKQKEALVEPLLDIVFDVHVFHPTNDKWHLGERIWEMAERGERPKNEYTGELIIFRSVILQYLENLLRYDAMHAPLHIIGTEVDRKFTLNIHPEGMPAMTLLTGGRIDRLDMVEGKVRVVDYKTGNHVPEVRNMEQVTGLVDNHEGYYLQTFLYAYAQMQADGTGSKVKPVLFYPGKASAADYNPTLHIGKDEVEDFAEQYAQEFVSGLRERITDIFSPHIPFTQCEDRKKCDRCDFKLLCLGRK